MERSAADPRRVDDPTLRTGAARGQAQRLGGSVDLARSIRAADWGQRRARLRRVGQGRAFGATSVGSLGRSNQRVGLPASGRGGAVAPDSGSLPDGRRNDLRDDEARPRRVAANLSGAGRDRVWDCGHRPPTGGLRLLGSLGGSVVANVPPRLRLRTTRTRMTERAAVRNVSNPRIASKVPLSGNALPRVTGGLHRLRVSAIAGILSAGRAR